MECDHPKYIMGRTNHQATGLCRGPAYKTQTRELLEQNVHDLPRMPDSGDIINDIKTRPSASISNMSV